MAIKIQTKDLYDIIEGRHPDWPNGLDKDHQLWAYNGCDSAVTLIVHHALTDTLNRRNDPYAATSYRFVRAMQGPAMAMMLRGVMVQQRVRQDETARAQGARNRAQALLDRLADAVWGPEEFTQVVKTKELVAPIGKKGFPLTPRWVTKRVEIPSKRPRGLNPNSPQQVLAFFNGALGFPVEYEIRKTATGHERTPTANDNALRKWASRRMKGPGVNVRDPTVIPVKLARPFVMLILTLRDLDKQLAVLRTPLEPSGRMTCSYNVAGTESGRWSSSKNAFGRGCVLAGTEVLTPTGWQTIETIKPFDTVMQWTSTGGLEWAPAQPYKTEYDGQLHKVESEQIHQEVTDFHSLPIRLWKNSTYTRRAASEARLLAQVYVPTAGKFRNEVPETEIPPWWSMCMADFSQEHGGWRGAFKRQRKIERFLEIAELYGLEYTEQRAPKGYRRFYMSGYKDLPKKWGPWVLNLSQQNLNAIVEEAQYWDSHIRGTSFIFFTADEEQATWFAIAAHLCGKGVTVHRKVNSEAAYKPGSIMWWVNVKPRNYAQIMRKHWTTREYKGPMYCLTVPSSFFLIRSNGKISVTGNSNLQNITNTMRRMFCADDGWYFISPDLEQAESRLVAGCVWEATGDDSYLKACLSGDLHTRVCMMAWPELGWQGEDPNHPFNRSLAESKYPDLGGLTYRDVAKRISHGSNYQGSPYGIAVAVGIPPWVVEEFQVRYFNGFPSIHQWHGWVREQLMTDQSLITPLLRQRIFFNRPNDQKTLREAIANVPQSTIAELLNLIMYRVWARSLLPSHHPDHLRIQLLLQNHDAFLLQTRDNLATIPQTINAINSEFQRAIVPFTRGNAKLDLNIPGEFMTGWNWAHADPKNLDFEDGNPDGLRKWDGEERRKRQQTAAVNPAEWLSGPVSNVY